MTVKERFSFAREGIWSIVRSQLEDLNIDNEEVVKAETDQKSGFPPYLSHLKVGDGREWRWSFSTSCGMKGNTLVIKYQKEKQFD